MSNSATLVDCTISCCRAGYSPNSVSKLRLNFYEQFDDFLQRELVLQGFCHPDWRKLLYNILLQSGYSPNSVSKLGLNASINIGPVLCFSRQSLGSRPTSDVYPNHFKCCWTYYILVFHMMDILHFYISNAGQWTMSYYISIFWYFSKRWTYYISIFLYFSKWWTMDILHFENYYTINLTWRACIEFEFPWVFAAFDRLTLVHVL